MMLFLLAAAFLAGTHAHVIPSVPMLDGRIAGGQAAQISEAPYQVALLLDYWNVGAYAQSCSGSIISSNVVLTVAHCIDSFFAIQWRARAGSSLHNTGGQVVQVNRYLMNPGFTNRLDSDVALMFMSRSFVLSTIVQTIQLPIQHQFVNESSIGLLTGWGTIVDQGPQPTQLNKVSLPIVSQEECEAAYISFNPVTLNMICAGRLGVGGAGACQGDSGSPFVINATLIGMTSWGRGCAQPDSPDVMVRVPNFVEWIENNLTY